MKHIYVLVIAGPEIIFHEGYGTLKKPWHWSSLWTINICFDRIGTQNIQYYIIYNIKFV